MNGADIENSHLDDARKSLEKAMLEEIQLMHKYGEDLNSLDDQGAAPVSFLPSTHQW